MRIRRIEPLRFRELKVWRNRGKRLRACSPQLWWNGSHDHAHAYLPRVSWLLTETDFRRATLLFFAALSLSPEKIAQLRCRHPSCLHNGGSNPINCASRQACYSGDPVKPGIKAQDSLNSMLFHDR